MNQANGIKPTGQSPERRHKPRSFRLSHPLAEFRFPGVPIYQLKVRDLSEKGAGIIVRPDSGFLRLIEIGQELNVKLISPDETSIQSGSYRSRIEHISAIEAGPYKGHMLVGILVFGKVAGNAI